MLDPSFSRSPHAPVFTALSEPAKSTSDIRLTFSPLTPLSKSVNVCVNTTVKTAWDLKYDMRVRFLQHIFDWVNVLH